MTGPYPGTYPEVRTHWQISAKPAYYPYPCTEAFPPSSEVFLPHPPRRSAKQEGEYVVIEVSPGSHPAKQPEGRLPDVLPMTPESVDSCETNLRPHNQTHWFPI